MDVSVERRLSGEVLAREIAVEIRNVVNHRRVALERPVLAQAVVKDRRDEEALILLARLLFDDARENEDLPLRQLEFSSARLQLLRIEVPKPPDHRLQNLFRPGALGHEARRRIAIALPPRSLHPARRPHAGG